MTRVLIVDDDPLIRRAILRLLPPGVKGVEAADARTALAAAEGEPIDLVLLDVCLDPQAPSVPTGLDLARTMRGAGMNVPVVVLSGSADPSHLREALRLDVQDYVFKSEIGLETMATLLADHVRAPLERERVPELAGPSPAAEAARRFAARAAASRAPVLLVGETGSGREALARAIHAASDRAARPLVSVRCSSTEPEVLESLLFGVQDPPEPGRVDRAAGGVLYLHEVGALPQALHAKVLRLIEGGAFVRARGRSEVMADVRVIASASPETSPKSFGGPLGGDLYLALAALLIRVPALRDRPGDIDAVVDDLSAANPNRPAFTEEARAVLRRRAWPGNVRELGNVVRAAGTFFGSAPVGAAELAHILPHESPVSGVARSSEPGSRAGQVEPPASGLSDLTQTILRIPDSDQRSLRAIEDTLIRQALAAAGGNKSAAARLLGVGRKFIERRVRSLGRDPR
jgi:DNA-binding NtrC family response regulator